MEDLEKYNSFKSYIESEEGGNGNTLSMSYGEFMIASNGVKPTHTKLTIRCPCGEIYYRSFNNFRNSKKLCVRCTTKQANKSKVKKHEDFLEEVYELVCEEYTVLSEYVDGKTKVRFKHNSFCENEFDMIPSNFTGVSQQRCPKCRNTKSHEQYVMDVEKTHGEEYTVLGNYTNAHTNVLVRHNSTNCNQHEWKVNAGNFIMGSGCPKCRISKGESTIATLLEKNNIEYDTQKMMRGCVDKRALKFDFAIYDKGSLKLLLEYDGEYHHILTRYRSAKDLLNGQQRRDAIKNTYCKDNNIPLLRIPYWEFDNIKTILEYELKHIM